MPFFYVYRTIRWYVTAEISFVRESIQGDEQTTATFRTNPEIMADIETYDAKELLVILFNHVANFLSVGSGWRFDSVQNLAISLCPFRSTMRAGSFIQTPKSLYNKGSPISITSRMISASYGAFSHIFTELINMRKELQNMKSSCMN